MDKNTIDRKFVFKATNPCNGKTYTEKDALILCAKDLAVPAALIAYMAECERLDCELEHIESINLLIKRVRDYQENNRDICKAPDTNLQCEIDRCIGGKDV